MRLTQLSTGFNTPNEMEKIFKAFIFALEF